MQQAAEKFVEKPVVLKGHDFSRAVDAQETDSALAAEEVQMIENTFLQGLKPTIILDYRAARLKPCPFKSMEFMMRRSFSAA